MTREDIVAMARAAMRDERLSDGALYGKLADEVVWLRAACERMMIGGNHIATYHTERWPDYGSEPMDALEKLGAGQEYDMWCCWNAIMCARDTLKDTLVARSSTATGCPQGHHAAQELNELAARHELAISLDKSDPGFHLSNEDMRMIAMALRQASSDIAEESKLREWAEDEQAARFKAEEDRMKARSDLCTYGPAAERKRSWILRFCDPEKDDMWFTNEPDAMRAFERASGHWTCTLYVTAEFVKPEHWTTELARAAGHD